jgi:hypothetical protein
MNLALASLHAGDGIAAHLQPTREVSREFVLDRGLICSGGAGQL